MKRAFFLFTISFFVVNNPIFAVDDSNSNVYKNEFVGIKFSVPEQWYVAADTEIVDVFDNADKIMDIDDPSFDSIMDQMPGKVILVISERPLNSQSDSVNKNILFMVLNARTLESEISSGADYLRLATQGIKQLFDSKTGSITPKKLGNEDFYLIDIEYSLQGIDIYAAQLAKIHNDYLIVANLTTDSRESLDDLIQMIDDNLELTAVSDEVSSSAAADTFRDNSTMVADEVPTRSNFSRYLKIGGIVLIFFGISTAFQKNKKA